MKRKIIGKLSCLFLFSSILITSCYKLDLSEISGDISLPNSLSIPLGNVSLSLDSIIKKAHLDEAISIEPTDNEINLTIQDEVNFNFRQTDFSQASFSPISFKYGFEDVPPGIEFSYSTPIEQTFYIDINDNPEIERIDSIVLSSFRVELSMANSAAIDLSKLEIITKFKEESVSQLDYSGKIVPGEVNNHFFPTNENPSGQIEFNNILIRPNTNNELPVSVIVKTREGESVIIGHNSVVDFKYQVENLNYKTAYGKFPAAIADVHTNRHHFDISALSGMKFANPQIALSIESNIGTYFSFNIDTICAYVDGSPQNAVYASFNGSPSTSIKIDKKPDYPGEWIKQDLPVFNSEFGKTDLLFGADPTPNVLEYKYSVSTYSKPSEGEETDQFITSDAEIKIYAKGIIPLYFKAGSNIEIKDTMSLQLGNITGSSDMLEEALLRLGITNGLPVAVDFKIEQFLDENDNPLLTSIKKEYEIESPEINADGTVKSTKEQTMDITLNDQQFEEIKKADKLIYSIKAHQNGENKIHFQPDNYFKIQMGVFVKGNLTLDTFSSNKENN